MKSAIIKTLVSVVAIVGATGVARAEMIGLYECTNVGVVGEDAIGDQAGHNLVSRSTSALEWMALSKELRT